MCIHACVDALVEWVYWSKCSMSLCTCPPCTLCFEILTPIFPSLSLLAELCILRLAPTDERDQTMGRRRRHRHFFFVVLHDEHAKGSGAFAFPPPSFFYFYHVFPTYACALFLFM